MNNYKSNRRRRRKALPGEWMAYALINIIGLAVFAYVISDVTPIIMYESLTEFFNVQTN